MTKVIAFFKRHPIIPVGVIVTCAVLAFLLQIYTIAKLSDQLHKQKEATDLSNKIARQIKQNSDDRALQLKNIQDHFDCVIALLQTPSHESYYISDIQNCDISKTTQTSTTIQPSPVPSTKSTTSLSADKNQPKQKPKAKPEGQDKPTSSVKPTNENFITKLLRSIGL